jgi:hypothetical protein
MLGTSEGAGSAASLPGLSPKNSFSFFLPAAAGELEKEIALTEGQNEQFSHKNMLYSIEEKGESYPDMRRAT